jgi:hypothetical protein
VCLTQRMARRRVRAGDESGGVGAAHQAGAAVRFLGEVDRWGDDNRIIEVLRPC